MPSHGGANGQDRAERGHQAAAEASPARADHGQPGSPRGGKPSLPIVAGERRAESGLVPDALVTSVEHEVSRSVGHHYPFGHQPDDVTVTVSSGPSSPQPDQARLRARATIPHASQSVPALFLTALIAFGPPQAQPSETFDVLIQNGRVMDGSGNPWIRGDVGIRGGVIAAIGHLPVSEGHDGDRRRPIAW